MRLPRDSGGIELLEKLEQYGYQITRQTGSHIRLTTQGNSELQIYDESSTQRLARERTESYPERYSRPSRNRPARIYQHFVWKFDSPSGFHQISEESMSVVQRL
jgi:hypothetical protein